MKYRTFENPNFIQVGQFNFSVRHSVVDIYITNRFALTEIPPDVFKRGLTVTRRKRVGMFYETSDYKWGLFRTKKGDLVILYDGDPEDWGNPGGYKVSFQIPARVVEQVNLWMKERRHAERH